jgi:hypothetical protein
VSGGIVQLFLNLGTRRGVWSASRPGRLYLRERPGTHFTGGWMGPGAGLDRSGKSRPTGIRSPDLPPRSDIYIYITIYIYTIYTIYTIYIYIYIYKTRLASNEIFSPSNKIHREVGRAKDLSAPFHFSHDRST